MTIEAMKQALEALEDTVNGCICRNCIKQVEAITSLSQAIEQAEKQEPVAWMSSHDVGFKRSEFGDTPTVPLYTTPQPQRELNCVCGAVWEGDEMVCVPHKRAWVGLTDEEIALVCAECAASAHNWNDISFARAIEAKLKEKNT
jgi:hypothetical protein